MKAYELMKLAAENPQAYEGRKYKAIGGNIIVDMDGKEYKELHVANGKLLATGKNRELARISSNLELEEIKPEPQPVPFLEAVKAFEDSKTVTCEESEITHTYKNCWGGMKDERGDPVTAREILHGTWYIED